MPKTAVLSSARTPFGKLGGALSTKSATELGAHAIEASLRRAEVRGSEVDYVIMGQTLQAGAGQIPSRQAQIGGGVPAEVPSETINKVCASGLRAVAIADLAIRAGALGVAVAGGMESMSNAPYVLPGARFGYRMGDTKLLDSMIQDGLRNPFTGKEMAVEAGEVSDELELTRVDLDRFALRSHERAVRATDEGFLAEEIEPIQTKLRGGDSLIELDEPPRRDTSLERLAKLAPVREGGSHTAGNAPGVNDGAGALVLADEEWANRNNRQVLARIVAHAQVADDFPYLARTPASAISKLLEECEIALEEIELFEINEAFASVALNSVRTLGIEEDRVNVNGGAIALGHPLGASGARIIGALIYELRRRGGGLGVAAICSGGGQGDAMLVEVEG